MVTLSPHVPEVKPATSSRILSDDEFREWAGRKLAEIEAEEGDEHRPTAGPDFVPTSEDQLEAIGLLNRDATDFWPASWPDLLEVSTVSDWDYQAEAAHEAERVASGNPWL